MPSATVLIVEDESDVRDVASGYVEALGYGVLTARNGDEALALVETCKPDLVLLDVMMPVRSGYEVCRRMREHDEWRHIKIIMLSAKGRDAEVNKGLSMGADLYITKPFSTRDLVSKVNALLGPD